MKKQATKLVEERQDKEIQAMVDRAIKVATETTILQFRIKQTVKAKITEEQVTLQFLRNFQACFICESILWISDVVNGSRDILKERLGSTNDNTK